MDNLTAGNLQFNQPIVAAVMYKLFKVLMSYGYFPASFGRSYTIPLPNGNASLGTAPMVDDFRAYLLVHCGRKFSNIIYLIGFPVFWTLLIVNLALRRALVVLILYVQLEALLISI